jgi:NADPH-dependent curcumin reductase CurA
VLKANPQGEPKTSDYEIVSETLRAIRDGEMLLKTKFLSLDPYMRSEFMNLPRSIGKKVIGGTLSEVVESKCEGWAKGDLVVGAYGWTEYAIGTQKDMQARGLPIQKWDLSLGAPSLAIGALGMTGFTAYHGLLNKTDPKKGETVVVSSSSGAVGQVVAQLAKIRGCKVVGIAGGPAKCRFCVNELGLDACIDYKDAANFRANLAAATTEGIGL